MQPTNRRYFANKMDSCMSSYIKCREYGFHRVKIMIKSCQSFNYRNPLVGYFVESCTAFTGEIKRFNAANVRARFCVA